MRLLTSYALSIGAVTASLTGCGGSQMPIDPSVAIPQSRAIAPEPEHAESWMLPEARSADLLYVASVAGGHSGAGSVTVYTYPQGKLVGDLKNFDRPNGLCVDKASDIFVADFYGEKIIEYAHGGTKSIAKFDDNGAPYGCAIDPTTGNLAVTNGCDGPIGSCYPDGTVLIYKHAKGRPEVLNDPDIPAAMAYCAYDKHGNLFVDSYGMLYQIGFAELLEGTKTFETLTLKLPKKAVFAGGLQWVGKYLAVGFADGNVVGQYQIRGQIGTRVHATLLKGVAPNFGTNQFWVEGNTLVAPIDSTKEYPAGAVEFFKYPHGGKAFETFSGSVSAPWAAAVSPAQTKGELVR